MKLRDLAAVFSAFSDRTRLRVLNLLANEGELCVCDIMSVLKEPQSKVSRHLGYLRRSGLVEARRKGLWMYYSLSKTRAGACLALLEDRRLRVDEFKKDLKALNDGKSCLVACCK